jgi:nucleoside-diphosphate-sugar epimerase/glycosyltransferase involved in cell wall biosynthesis
MEKDKIELADQIRALDGPIVVFGAGGFIGSNLLRALLAVRPDCFGVTHQRYIGWRLVDLPVANLLYADLTDKASLQRLLAERDFRTIFNFAAYGGYSKQQDPDLIYRTNLLGTVDLLEIAAAQGFSAFINAGSSSEYGLNSAAPGEEAALVPNSHYAVSKVAAAYLTKYYGEQKKLPVLNLRYYSVYGPYEEPDRLVPRLIEEALAGKLPPLADPEVSRDFVYVDDAVAAAILAAALGVKKAPGRSVNIASGKKTTLREIVAVTKELLPVKAEPAWAKMPNREWDLKDWYGDPSLARELFGWQAATPLKDGLGKTIDWTKRRPAGKIVELKALGGRPVRLSAVIACYNDARAIPIMHERLTRVFNELKVDYEIIFVNDASPDNTDEVVKGLAGKDNHVIAIEHSRNFGSQSAFLSGMQIATGDAVVLMDGDLQDPPEMIAEFFRRWKEGYEVVYGRRVRREASRLMNFFYKAFYRVFRGVAYVPMPLDAGDFSLIDRKVADQLVALPETDLFLRGLRAWVGFRQTGVDYVRPERMFGRSTNSWRKNFWWARKAIFSFSFVPLELLSYASLALTSVSLIAIVWQVLVRLFFPGTPQGLSTIIVLILFFGAVQMLAISIIGEYLSKIFEEAKRRPKFIRKAIRYGGDHFSEAAELEKFISRRKPG